MAPSVGWSCTLRIKTRRNNFTATCLDGKLTIFPWVPTETIRFFVCRGVIARPHARCARICRHTACLLTGRCTFRPIRWTNRPGAQANSEARWWRGRSTWPRMAACRSSRIRLAPHFCLWQGNQTPGIGIAGEDNTFCWADLMTRDRDGREEVLRERCSVGKRRPGKARTKGATGTS